MPTKIIKPQGVCSREIQIDYDDNGVITNCQFTGGCQGNTGGISSLVKGLKVSLVVERLEGITCRGSRFGDTSCPDQLAKGLKDLL